MTTRARTSSPPPKRIKLESGEVILVAQQDADKIEGEDSENDEDHCSICLHAITDRTIIPTCSHEFCFECLLVWTVQSRRCPLCSQDAGEYLIHHIRSKYDFQKHYLPPLQSSPQPRPMLSQNTSTTRRRTRREVQWGRTARRAQEREAAAIDDLERAIEKRKWIYRHRLYAKHVASNSFTRYRPYPTPTQFAANSDLITRATIFVRRELRVWGCLDVEFLTTFTISLMKSLDIRSESAVKLLAEFLDMDAQNDLRLNESSTTPRPNAEHFAHELYCYLRSPYRDLSAYDKVVQYDIPEGLPPPHWHERSRRWRSPSRTSSRSRHSLSRSRSHSRSAYRVQHSGSDVVPSDIVPRSDWRSRSCTPKDVFTDRRKVLRISPTRHSTAADSSRSSDDNVDGNRDRGLRDGMTPPENQDFVSRDVKGKGRAIPAIDCVRSENHTPDVVATDFASTTRAQDIYSPSSQPEPSYHGLSGPPSTPVLENRLPDHAAVVLPSRPRIQREAWASVQTHLSSTSVSRKIISNNSIRTSGSTSRGELSVKGAALAHATATHLPESSQPAAGSAESAGSKRPQRRIDNGRNVPSLLQRLSDPGPDIGDSSNVHNPPGGEQHVLSNNTSTAIPHAVAGQSSSRMSAPEIMARTRARLARITQDPKPERMSHAAMETDKGILLPNSSRTIDDVSQAADGVIFNPFTAEQSQSSISLSNTQSWGSPDLRAQLFSKLEDEKRLQYQTSLGISDSFHVLSGSSTPSHMELRTSGSPVEQSEQGRDVGKRAEAEVEEDLRRQVRLRARLAAEKRAAAGHDVDVSVSLRPGGEVFLNPLSKQSRK